MTKQTKCVRCRKRIASPVSAYCGACEEIIEEIEEEDMEINHKECRKCKAVQGFYYIRNRLRTSEIYLTKQYSNHDERIFFLPLCTKIDRSTGLCYFCKNLK